MFIIKGRYQKLLSKASSTHYNKIPHQIISYLLLQVISLRILGFSVLLKYPLWDYGCHNAYGAENTSRHLPFKSLRSWRSCDPPNMAIGSLVAPFRFNLYTCFVHGWKYFQRIFFFYSFIHYIFFPFFSEYVSICFIIIFSSFFLLYSFL